MSDQVSGIDIYPLNRHTALLNKADSYVFRTTLPYRKDESVLSLEVGRECNGLCVLD